MKFLAGALFFTLIFNSNAMAQSILNKLDEQMPIGQTLEESKTETVGESSQKSQEEKTSINDNGPWMVCDIEYQGLQNVKGRTVKSNTKAREKKNYEAGFVNEDIQSLVGLGLFEKVSVDINPLDGENYKDEPCYKIIYHISEKPIIEKIEIEGRKKLSKGDIYDAMSLKKDDAFDSVQLEMDEKRVEKKYEEKGYIAAKVKIDYEMKPEKNKVVLKVNVDEGKRARVKEVRIIGLEDFPEKKVVKKLKNRNKKVFKKENVDKDLKRLTDFYKNDGYQDFEIKKSSITYSADSSEVYINYWIEEGVPSVFGETNFYGNAVYSDKELQKLIEYRKGKKFRQDRFDETITAIQERYADKGYLNAYVVPEKKLDSKTGKLDIDFTIEENNIVYIRYIDVGGYKATKPYVIKREVVAKEGDVFSRAKIVRSMEKIWNLGFFDDVQPGIHPTENKDEVDVTFDVVEGKPGMFTAGAAISSLDGLVGELSVQHMNLFGRAQRLAFSWSFGARVLDYSVSWTTPWIFGKPISFGTDLFNRRRVRPFGTDSTAYTEHRTGGRIRVGPRFNDDKYQLNFSYGYEEVEIDGVDDDLKDQITEGSYATSTLFSEFAIDTRDDIYDPKKGWRNSLSLSLTGGPLMGDVDFYKVGLSSNYNYKLFDLGTYPFVLAFSNRFGFVERFADTKEVPLFERYFLGGSESIRGYNSSSRVGPENGGTVYYIYNTELRFPLAKQRKRTILQGAFFFDMGNAWSGFDDVTLGVGPKEHQMKTGVGFGIRFTTPAFPIRLDWGYGLNHNPGEDRSELYFSIGNPF
jgi:outer membrane protein insertion porin family